MIKFFKKYKHILLVFSILIFSNKVFSQNDCESAFVEATNEFEIGNYQKVIELMQNRISECDYSKETKLQIYKMLTSSYKEIDDIENSEYYTLKFIRKEPEYSIQSIDQVSFINSFQKFSCRPNWTVGITFSMIRSDIAILSHYQIFQNVNEELSYSADNQNILTFYFQKYFSKRFSTIVDFTNYNFNIVKTVNFDEFYNYVYTESSFISRFTNYYSLNLFNKRRVGINCNVGWYAYLYSKNTYKLQYTYSGIEDVLTGDVSEKKRWQGVVGVTGGLSLNYKFDRFSVVLLYRYMTDFFPINNPSERYRNTDLIFDYYLIDDDFKIAQNEIQIGFSYNLIYKIKHKYK